MFEIVSGPQFQRIAAHHVERCFELRAEAKTRATLDTIAERLDRLEATPARIKAVG